MVTTKRFQLGLACGTVALLGVAAWGAEFSLKPVSATGAHTLNGNEIILQGGGQTVTLELRMDLWAPVPDVGVCPDQSLCSISLQDCAFGTCASSNGLLQAYQARVDSSGYGGVLTPAFAACAVDGDCLIFGAPFATCDTIAGACNPDAVGYIDSNNPEYVFVNASVDIPAVDTTSANWAFGSVVIFETDAVPYAGVDRYGGTLVLDVPIATAGVFTIGFVEGPIDTFFRDSTNTSIVPVNTVAAVINVQCQSNADCDDSSVCTTDTCNPDGTCTYVNTYDDAVFCCNPVTGVLAPLDDGNECTVGICDPGTGEVGQQPVGAGTACGGAPAGQCDAQDTCDGFGLCVEQFASNGTVCGDPGEAECNHADTCDGAGACQANIELPGAACGDPTDTDCNGADTCDGSGACQNNLVPVGLACGDPAVGDCNSADTCDGAGVCLPNYAPGGLPCGNPVGDQCDNPDTCDAVGVCQPNAVVAGTACGNPGSSECDSPDSCDGAGACDPNPQPDGTTCTDDGNECRDDVCLSGVCSHPFSAAGALCGNPADSECDRADSCDGAGTCQSNLEPGGAACGDPTDTDCDRADACDGGGTCLTNIEPGGTACGDPSSTDCNAPDTCDGTGVCQGNVAPAGLPCGNPVGNQCDNPDSCDGAGACEPNFVAPGTACGNPSSSECDSSDTCDGGGVCDPNHLADGSACTDDGNDCRDDLCLSGVCSHPLSAAGTPCGDPTDTECNGFDSCDGSGTCLLNLVAAAMPCGDPSTTECTDPDACDGFGNCQPNDLGDGLACDDALFCVDGTICQNGVCGGGAPLDCDDGLTCTADSCSEGAMGCANDLIAGNCLIGGACYADGGLNPANDCEVCDAALAPTSWTLQPVDSPCSDGDVCTNGDVCDALGVCIGVIDPACNDECINAVEVFDGSNVSNNDNRGPDDDEALCQFDSDNDVWFFYNASCDGRVRIDTIGSVFTPSNDTVLSVFDACGGAEIACDDDAGPGLLSLLEFDAVAGVSYYIRVAGFMGNSGDIVLNIATLNSCVIGGMCVASGAINPGAECEACIPLMSSIAWSPRSAGSSCGAPASGQCDSADSCDGNGVCEINNKPDQTSCGDDGNDCTNDFCLSGVCSHPAKQAGAACGDPASTACDVADSCDGAGVCLVNFLPAGLPCGDPSTSDCDNADVCDGAGACDPNHQADGLICTDDGIECTFDQCDTGVCVHPARPVGTVCGDAGDTECDNPDTCDGSGGCLDNFEPALVACGDLTDTECDNPDSCDGGGLCVLNYEPVGFGCGDPTDTGCDNADTCNGQGTCLVNLEPAGFPCGDPSNTQCDDPDTCDGTGACLSNFEPTGLPCGDPSTSECDNADSCDGGGGCDVNHQADGLACTDDGNECTSDACDTGVCEHPPQPAGTSCGNASDTECDNPDTCDGASACQPNNEPSGLACGDPADTDCNNPDTCDGTGACALNLEPTGFACGDPADTGCNNPDTCDASGTCLDNFEINGFPCGDPASTQCDNPDTCDGGGTCLGNPEPSGLPCGDPTNTECDNADVCDGVGACDDNNVTDGTPCTDEGNDCTNDVCAAGACDHPFEPVGTACGDQSDTECNNPDNCDGAGGCLDNFVSAGTACGDPSDDQCDHPDICDGGGACDVNFEADGTTCDDTDVCTGGDACTAGACAGTAVAQAPTVAALGSRRLEITPLPAGAPGAVALLVTSPDFPCLSKYVQADGLLDVTPVFQLIDDWSPIIALGEDIIPSSQADDTVYEIRAECGTFLSDPGATTMGIWGDTDGNGEANFADILNTVRGFQNDFSLQPMEVLDLWPCLPDNSVTFDDILRVVQAFQGQTYADTLCPIPCS